MKLDLHKVYYQIWIKKNDKWKTAFWMKYKHFEYIVMLFELKNVSIIF